MVDMVLNMAGRTSWNLINVLLAVGVNLGLDLRLIPTQGILGAAIGWAAAIVVTNSLAVTQIAVAMRLHPRDAAAHRRGRVHGVVRRAHARPAPLVGMSLPAQAGVWAGSVLLYGALSCCSAGSWSSRRCSRFGLAGSEPRQRDAE